MITKKQIQNTTETLQKLEPGKVPLEIFSEMARLSVTPVVELIPFKKDANGQVSVLLLQRSNDDLLWPGQFHVPGSIVLATDTADNFQEAIIRCSTKLHTPSMSEPRFVGTMLCTVNRGTEVAVLYCAELLDDPSVGAWYAATDLPDNMINGQREFVQAAVRLIET